MKTLSTQIEEILLTLVEKRGKHSKLWMYPKSESLKIGVDEVLQAVTKMVEEDIIGNYDNNKKPPYFNVNDLRTRNDLRFEQRAKLKELL